VRRALVTGAAGFAGQWLCQELLRRGVTVTGAALAGEIPPGALTADERRAVIWKQCDMTRMGDVRAAVDAANPDMVFHLAGVAFVPAADKDPGAAVDVNVGGAARLLGDLRVRRAAGTLDPVVIIAGSGEQYGRHDAADLPLRETAGQRPLSVYAASKAAQEAIALESHRSAGVRVIAARAFNHSGPGQSPQFLLPALVARALAARASGARTLSIGNTAPVRDFLHVADVARAYALLAERGTPGEAYNIASGTGTGVAALAQAVLARAKVDAALAPDPALQRPVDVPALVGDASKLRSATGWAPEHSLDSLIDELIRAAPR
jgi:GDP-4-dehydro-6-deoxy-D-mannose reductase